MNTQTEPGVTNQLRDVAKHAAIAFGVHEPPVVRLHDGDRRSEVFVLRATDTPGRGVTSYSTVGLSDHPLIHRGSEFGTRAELAGACGSSFTRFENILATAAFCVINSRWFCAPGVIFPDVVKMSDASSSLTDIYFANPFVWGDRLKTTRIGGQKISWLLAVPIARSEALYAEKNGSKALEKLFESSNIDIFDLNRRAIV